MTANAKVVPAVHKQKTDIGEIEVDVITSPDGYVMRYTLTKPNGKREQISVVCAAEGETMTPGFVIYAGRHLMLVTAAQISAASPQKGERPN